MEGERRRTLRWALGLLGLGIAQRAALLWLYSPVEYGDTPTYKRLAGVLLERGFAAYDATRVPGYPLFVGALGRDNVNIMLAQMGLGLAISLLLFAIVRSLTGSPKWGFAAGLLYHLSPGQVLFETNLLSETLTTFLLAASLALYLSLRARAGSRVAFPIAFVLGLTSAAAGLVRTLFFFLPVLLLPFVFFEPHEWRRRLTIGALFSVGPLLLLGGWIGFVYSHYEMLSPTTMGGYHLVQHTGGYFEYLPDDEAVIRDTYLKYREQQVQARGTQTNAIWEAIPELTEKTGLSFFALSAKLQRLSLQLIREHPLLYLRNAAEGWVDFWKAPVYWRAGAAAPELRPVLGMWELAGRALAILANGLFLAGTLLTGLSRRVRGRLDPPRFIVLTTVLVLASSVVQTLVDHGDNPRFLVPLQMIVIVNVLWAGWRWYESGRRMETRREAAA